LSKLIDQSAEHHIAQKTYLKNISEKLLILEDLKKSKEEAQSNQDLKIDFTEDDPRLSVTKIDDQVLSGSLALADMGIVEVVCDPIKEELMRYGEKGPRHVVIYARLSANTLVHPFYGIAERHGQRWAVMRDLRNCLTLGGAIQNEAIPESTLERISIAYDIAKTVEYLHSVEVLVKRLSDRNVVLVCESGAVTPYLTNLERARLVCVPLT
jgi:hypothetical protein